MHHLELTSEVVPTMFRISFNHYVCGIGELIKNDLIYAKVVAAILVPESQDFLKVGKNTFTIH